MTLILTGPVLLPAANVSSATSSSSSKLADAGYLERNNLLDMGATTIQPGQVLVLVYKKGLGPLSDGDVLAAVDKGKYLFSLSPVVTQGASVAVAAKVNTNISALSASLALADVSNFGPFNAVGFGAAPLTLKYAVKRPSGTGVAIPDDVAAAAAAGEQLPAMRSDPLGIVSAASAAGRVASGVSSTVTTWLVLALLIVAAVQFGGLVSKR